MPKLQGFSGREIYLSPTVWMLIMVVLVDIFDFTRSDMVHFKSVPEAVQKKLDSLAIFAWKRPKDWKWNTPLLLLLLVIKSLKMRMHHINAAVLPVLLAKLADMDRYTSSFTSSLLPVMTFGKTMSLAELECAMTINQCKSLIWLSLGQCILYIF